MNKKELLEQKKKYAAISGFKLNPNEAELDIVIDGLLKNKEKYEFFYCPCRKVTGNQEEDRKKICPCIWHKDEIEKNGFCHCRLFFKK